MSNKFIGIPPPTNFDSVYIPPWLSTSRDFMIGSSSVRPTPEKNTVAAGIGILNPARDSQVLHAMKQTQVLHSPT
ncbi:MAG: hypothetical protein ACLP5V_13465 [Candidatus Bathyarchaeia archaeon]